MNHTNEKLILKIKKRIAEIESKSSRSNLLKYLYFGEVKSLNWVLQQLEKDKS